MEVLSLILIIFVGSSFQSTPEDKFYEAGVVEFAYERFENISAATRLASYLDQYLKIMDDAPANLDIIVFPEMTLNEFDTAVKIPEVKDNISPCVSNDYSSENVVKRISCAARSFRRYVVVNIVTKAECPDPEMVENKDPRSCKDREDGFSYYNTNVVFDRNGTLISRYRKFNLFGEKVDKPHKPAMVIFDTDFGIKFGHFICFDLMFRRPALELTRFSTDGYRTDLQDIIFTTMWFSELPFLTAVQVQQNWAYSNNVNLLAAGANNPGFGSTGTGIYSGEFGSIISVMEGAANTTLYTATVPKKRVGILEKSIEHKAIRYTKEQMKSLTLKRDQLDSYKLEFLTIPAAGAFVNYTRKVCQDQTCCNYTINYRVENPSNLPGYEYAVGFYHGKRTFDGFADGGIIACAIIACQTRDVKTCGVRNESLGTFHVFDDIRISGELPFDDGQYFYLPTSLDTSILPLSPKTFSYYQNRQTTMVNGKKSAFVLMNSRDQIKDILTFGIYGRDFNLDENAAGMFKISNVLLLISAVLVAIRMFN